MPMQQKKTVFVGLSGGVDSSVAVLRLLREGYAVVGVFIKVWHPDFLECNWEAERVDAMRVAAHLGIPFLTCDAEAAYKQEVADHFIKEYAAGRTPNPDVLCNQAVKFGAFLQFATAHGAEYIATGHYARKIEAAHGPELWRGIDSDKDQSYFLWTLTKQQLARTLFPVGDTHKSDIRAIAAKAWVPVAQKKDSQGICFLGAIDIPDFLSHYIDLQEGDVLDESGTVIGRHKGAFVYTIGQRHGFDIHKETASRTPHYVIAKDVEMNTITVSHNRPVFPARSALHLQQVNWIGAIPEEGASLQAQIRYRQQPFTVFVQHTAEQDAVVAPQSDAELPAAGQSCVLYEGERCVGGGIIA